MRVLLIIASLSACRNVHVPDLILHDGQSSADGAGDASGDSGAGDPISGDPLAGDTMAGDPLAGDTTAGDPWTPPEGAVYDGTAAIADSASSGMVAIGGTVERAKAIVFHQTTRNADGNPSHDAVTAELVDAGDGTSTQLRFRRADAGPIGCTIQWSVVYFASGVNVQHGERSLAASTEDLTLTPVTVASSFVISSWRGNDASYGLDDWGITELTSATNLRIRNSASGVSVRYQVVDMIGASVQQRGITVTGDGSTSNDNASISAVDRARTFLVASQQGVNPGNNRSMGARVHLTSDTNLRCTHHPYSLPREVWTYVVQLPSGRGTVEQKTPTMGTSAQDDITIATVDVGTTSVFSPFQGLIPAQNSLYEFSNPAMTMSHRLLLSAPTTVRIDREAAAMPIDLSFYVVEWVTD